MGEKYRVLKPFFTLLEENTEKYVGGVTIVNKIKSTKNVFPFFTPPFTAREKMNLVQNIHPWT